MAKKKLSRDQKRKQKKQQRAARRQPVDAGQRMIRRAQERGLATKFVSNPAGAEKMSDVLTDFFEPYQERIPDTPEAMRKLVTTAIIAWNMAVLPVDARVEKLQSFLAELPAETHEDFTEVIGEMIRRKETYFAGYNRIILDYELTDQGGGDYHISVMSTMPDSGQEE
jgi:hypothetical protein